MITDITFSRDDLERLTRTRARLAKELSEWEIAGLDERAKKTREELERVSTRLAAAQRQRHEVELDRLQRKNDALGESPGGPLKKRRKRTEATATAREWLKARSLVLLDPQPVTETLAAARVAGIHPDALLAATVRVQRRRDGVDCLAPPGRYRRKHYFDPSEP